MLDYGRWRARAAGLLAVWIIAAGLGGCDHPNPRDDLAAFAALLEGRFDNASAVAAGVEGAQRQHFLYRKVEAPAFRGVVHVVQQYAGDGSDRASTYRQRLYVSTLSDDGARIVTRIFAFPKAAEADMLDAYRAPTKLRGLTPDVLEPLPDGCEIIWRREEAGFVGVQAPGDCRLTLPGGQIVALEDDLLLTPEAFTTHTRGLNPEGVFLFGDAQPVRRARAEAFLCQSETIAPFRLHDQDGSAATSAGPARLKKLGAEAFELTLGAETHEGRRKDESLAFAAFTPAINCQTETPFSF
jgi:hypothetical protein